MRKLAAVLLIAIATTSFAQTPKEVAGSYKGPEASYGLVLELAPDGTLRGNYVEMGSVAVLNAIQVRGAQFTARASFDDGSLRTISGAFESRTQNGRRVFGLRLNDVPVEDRGLVETFFERL
jgi:hypothetical protein